MWLHQMFEYNIVGEWSLGIIASYEERMQNSYSHIQLFHKLSYLALHSVLFESPNKGRSTGLLQAMAPPKRESYQTFGL